MRFDKLQLASDPNLSKLHRFKLQLDYYWSLDFVNCTLKTALICFHSVQIISFNRKSNIDINKWCYAQLQYDLEPI